MTKGLERATGRRPTRAGGMTFFSAALCRSFNPAGGVMAPDGSELLELVGRLHEGVADDAMWDRAFEGVSQMLGIGYVLMGAVSPDGRDVRLQFGHSATHSAV